MPRFSTRSVVLAVLLALVSLAAAPASAAADQDREQDYLALGDSVAFGTNPLLNPSSAANFVGYPTPVASALDENLTNASCPGEASGGFISLTGVDNICRPYRAHFPLHVAYTTSQLDFALAFLARHPHTRLVTVSLGANDLFVLLKGCKGAIACVQAGLPGMLAALSGNLDAIFGALRNRAHYSHQLVAVTYYSLDYRDPVGTALIAVVDQVVADRVQAWRGETADGFGAFAAASGNGDTCAAGLRIPLPGGGCDIHPSAAGRALLAGAVVAVVRHREGVSEG